jgi:hypothetical protein
MHIRQDRDRSLEPSDRDVDSALPDECAAFLAGRWAEERDDPERPLPMWAWLNLVAHGDLDRIQAVAARTDGASRGSDQLQSVLARAVISAIPAGELTRVQRDVLVPLELELINTPSSPRRVLELVTTALFEPSA